MILYITGCFIIFCGGLYALVLKENRYNSLAAVVGVCVGNAVIFIPVFNTLLGNCQASLDFNWSMFGGTLSFGMDSLSAFFCLPIVLISPLAALYGKSYLSRVNKGLSFHWFFYCILVISMFLLMVSRNSVMFLIIWELMAVSSFFLVMFDHENEKVCEAGWTYFVATHIGTAALLIFFAWLGTESNSMQFDQIALIHPNARSAGVLFLLALLGFGVKAGFVPLHIWLPEAHPAAPSHVSALMSGVMIKTGIYGILRVLILLGSPTAAWGWTLVIIGIVSGIIGVVFALVQRDIKRLLAYSSVENIGIIAIGLGVGVLGIAWNMPALIILGFGGGLLHVLNHAIFKSLLFLGAGAVAHSTGTRDIEQLGGLIKRMRWTGIIFLIGSAAIAGLPLLNGFISEFYIYLAAISGVNSNMPGPIILAASVLIGLSLIGGLAVACFTKAVGIIFLGESRIVHAEHVQEVNWMMKSPMAIIALLCILIGLFAPLTIFLIIKPVENLVANNSNEFFLPVLSLTGILIKISFIYISIILLTSIVYFLRKSLPNAKHASITGTWDCGYARPTSRMQYTASSFSQPLTSIFKFTLGTHKTGKLIEGYFPPETTFHTHTPDIMRKSLFEPFFKLITKWVSLFRKLQHGNLHGYLLYIALTLIILLIWKVGFSR